MKRHKIIKVVWNWEFFVKKNLYRSCKLIMFINVVLLFINEMKNKLARDGFLAKFVQSWADGARRPFAGIDSIN